ncbi:MAG: hypothetical protein ACRDTA_27800 [Pseudonocardiaceae bacterium]
MTSARDGFEHLVAESAMTPGSAGRYVAGCGRVVWAAALASPPRPRCPACVTVRNPDAAVDEGVAANTGPPSGPG